jgi:hypothetical protein
MSVISPNCCASPETANAALTKPTRPKRLDTVIPLPGAKDVTPRLLAIEDLFTKCGHRLDGIPPPGLLS